MTCSNFDRLSRRAMLAASALALSSVPVFAQDKLPVTWWYEQAAPDNQGFLEEFVIKAFNESNAEHELSIDFRGSGLDRQLRMALLSGTGPDIVFTPGPSYVASMALAGQLLPLNDYATELGWTDRLLPAFLDMGTYNGVLYAVPKTYETLGLFYNKTLFDARGWTPPTTLEELDTLAQAMLAEGIVPFAVGNADWRGTNEHYVSIALNSVAGPDNVAAALRGEIPWTSEPFVRAINTLNGWWQKGYFGPDYFSLTGEQAFLQVATGKAGLAPTGTWAFGWAARDFPANNAEAAFAGFPSGEGVPYPIYALGIGSTFSIATTSKNPDGAAQVIDHIFSPEFYEQMNSVWLGEWNTPLKDLSGVTLADTVMPLYTETMAQLAETVNANQYGYTTWTFMPPATNSYLISGIEEVWLGRITTADYLAQLDATFQQELAEGKVSQVPARN